MNVGKCLAHTAQPDGYLTRSEWMETMSRTYRQVQCPRLPPVGDLGPQEGDGMRWLPVWLPVVGAVAQIPAAVSYAAEGDGRLAFMYASVAFVFTGWAFSSFCFVKTIDLYREDDTA